MNGGVASRVAMRGPVRLALLFPGHGPAVLPRHGAGSVAADGAGDVVAGLPDMFAARVVSSCLAAAVCPGPG